MEGKRANATGPQVLNFNRDAVVGTCVWLTPCTTSSWACVASKWPSGSSEKLSLEFQGLFSCSQRTYLKMRLLFYLNFIPKLILFCELKLPNLVILYSPPCPGLQRFLFGCLYNLTAAVLKISKAWYKCSYYYYLMKTEKLFIDQPFFFFFCISNKHIRSISKWWEKTTTLHPHHDWY